MNPVGRIVSRGKGIVGLFLPVGDMEALPKGIYNVIEFDGSYTLQYVGPAALEEPRFTALDPNGLLDHRPYSTATADEVNKYTEAGLLK